MRPIPLMAPADRSRSSQAKTHDPRCSAFPPRVARGLAAVGILLVALGASRADQSSARATAPRCATTLRGATTHQDATDPASPTGPEPSPPPDPSSPPPLTATTADSPFLSLPALHVVNVNTRLSIDTRLYDALGLVDRQAAARLDTLLGDLRDPERPRVIRLDRRTLQLVYRAAYNFRTSTVEVLSAYRAPRGQRAGGQHASGRAIDFKLPGVAAATLAAYLRSTPRAGVGVYTHRRTQYVHLDTRELSHHWLDASPPGKRWREVSIGGRSMNEHDARYQRAEDWPEGTVPPSSALRWHRARPQPQPREGLRP